MSVDALVERIEAGDVAAVEAALRAEPALANQQLTDFKDRPLHVASWKVELVAATLLIGYGADVNATGDHDQSALHYCVKDGDERCIPLVAALLRLGADPSLRDRANRDVEERAKIGLLDGGLPNVLDLLRRRGQPAGPVRGDLVPLVTAGDVMGVANAVKANTASASPAALAAACEREQLAIVAVLLGYGVDLAQPDALHRAARNHTLEGAAIVGLLLAAGADPDGRDATGQKADDVADERAQALLAYRRARPRP